VTDKILIDISDDIAHLEVHDNARSYILEKSEFFWQALTAESKLRASMDEDDVVLKSHAQTAYRRFFNVVTPRSRRRELISTAAGLFVGIGAPGILSEMSNEKINAWLVLLYAAFTVSGIVAFVFYFFDPLGMRDQR